MSAPSPFALASAAPAWFWHVELENAGRVRAAVPSARPRQVNCYASSSDGGFADRCEASDRYGDLLNGAVPVECGWRVYSSGAGIAVHLERECLLGVRLGRLRLTLDPVLPRSLDGLVAALELDGRELEIVFERGCGPTALALNDQRLPFEREPNPYRTGAAAVPMDAVRGRLATGRNRLVVELE